MNKNQLKGRLIALKMQKEEAEDKTKKATRLLFYVAGVNALFGVFAYFEGHNLGVIIFSLMVSLVILALGFWSSKQPLVPLVLASLLLGAMFTLDFLDYERIGLIGISLRVVVLIILFTGIYHVYSAGKILKKYLALQRELESLE